MAIRTVTTMGDMDVGEFEDIILSVGPVLLFVFVAGFYVFMIYMGISETAKEKRYMGEQIRETYMGEQIRVARDKQRMLDFMQIVMKEYYNDYTYAVGNNLIMVKEFQANYYPYIVCFNKKDIVIISYKMQNGALICRNVLPVDWSCMRLKYRVNGKGVRLRFQLGKTRMQVNVNRVVVSSGSENSDTPLGIVQIQEVDKLIQYLPHYQG